MFLKNVSLHRRFNNIMYLSQMYILYTIIILFKHDHRNRELYFPISDAQYNIDTEYIYIIIWRLEYACYIYKHISKTVLQQTSGYCTYSTVTQIL